MDWGAAGGTAAPLPCGDQRVQSAPPPIFDSSDGVLRHRRTDALACFTGIERSDTRGQAALAHASPVHDHATGAVAAIAKEKNGSGS